MGSVLLVEVDATISDTWMAALTAAGHAVMVASGMREARAVVREGGIDVIVIDAHDPRAGVVELARDINALPDAPPIILISASPAAPATSVRIRAATFIPKPCDPGTWSPRSRARVAASDRRSSRTTSPPYRSRRCATRARPEVQAPGWVNGPAARCGRPLAMQ